MIADGLLYNRMRRKKRKEPPVLLILVVLIGFFQVLYIYGSSETPFTKEDVPERSMVSNDDRKHGMFYEYFKQNNTDVRGNNNNNIVQTATMSSTMRKSDTVDGKLPLSYYIRQFIPPYYDPIIYGHQRSRKGFLTIGIPSIRRPNTDRIYLYKTIESLINNTSEEEQRGITLVVMLSDFNETYNERISREIFVRFQKYCLNGFIRIIKAPRTMYPSFDKLKLTLHDPVHRVHWRSKQNIDFGYLFFYCKNISEYYLQLEDDVLSAQNYSIYIRNQIRSVSKPWFMLEFSRLGFIGKLFKDRDLVWVGNYLLKNFGKAPGDLFLGKMRVLHGQKTPIHTDFSLFQHNGKFSSLKNKMMPSIDSKFKDADKVNLPIMILPKGNNPPAKFFTSFETIPGYLPSHAYDNDSSTYFWAKRPQRLDYFTLLFEKPQNFSRIIISTGDAKRKRDSLTQSTLSVSMQQTTASNSNRVCEKFLPVAEFIDGEIDTKAMGLHIPKNILCLKIQLKKNSKTWVIIREIVLI